MLDLNEALLLLVLVLVLRDGGRVLAQQECGKSKVAAQPDAAQVAHGVAHAQDGQAAGHADAAQHQDGEHKQRLRIPIRPSALMQEPGYPCCAGSALN